MLGLFFGPDFIDGPLARFRGLQNKFRAIIRPAIMFAQALPCVRCGWGLGRRHLRRPPLCDDFATIALEASEAFLIISQPVRTLWFSAAAHTSGSSGPTVAKTTRYRARWCESSSMGRRAVHDSATGEGTALVVARLVHACMCEPATSLRWKFEPSASPCRRMHDSFQTCSHAHMYLNHLCILYRSPSTQANTPSCFCGVPILAQVPPLPRICWVELATTSVRVYMTWGCR